MFYMWNLPVSSHFFPWPHWDKFFATLVVMAVDYRSLQYQQSLRLVIDYSNTSYRYIMCLVLFIISPVNFSASDSYSSFTGWGKSSFLHRGGSKWREDSCSSLGWCSMTLINTLEWLSDQIHPVHCYLMLKLAHCRSDGNIIAGMTKCGIDVLCWLAMQILKTYLQFGIESQKLVYGQDFKHELALFRLNRSGIQIWRSWSSLLVYSYT